MDLILLIFFFLFVFFALGLAWQAAFKKTKVKLDTLTDIDMLFMIQKGIRGGIYQAVHRYVTANNKCMKYYDKTKESSYLNCWGVNTLYGWVMSQKLPVGSIKWVENTPQFNKGFIRNYNEDIFNILKSSMNFKMIYLFFLKQ